MGINLFFCYAREDESLVHQLQTQLRSLQLQGLIEMWFDRDIKAGTDWKQEIMAQLDAAHIILLMISPDFFNSDYCYGIEMQRALLRHQSGKAIVVPVILRHVHWQHDLLRNLQALPMKN